MVMMLVLPLLCALARVVYSQEKSGNNLPPSSSKSGRVNLQQEIDQYSSGTGNYGQVKNILDQLRRKSPFAAPDARGPPNGSLVIENPEDDTELSRNSRIAGDLFEGDIVLRVDQATQILQEAESENSGRPPQRRRKRKVVSSSLRWPSNVIYYTFDPSLADYKIRVIKAALKAWEDNTCLRFQQGRGRGDYVTFMSGSGCYSHIGRGGGQQAISIGDGCEVVGITAHEIAHALGFWHEQHRYDRNNYIRIEYQNINPYATGNFMRISSRQMNDFGEPYDLGSVMHYGAKAFSTSQNLFTIRTFDRSYQNTIGQRQWLSFIDVKQMNRAYCYGVCKNQLPCRHDGYPDPTGEGSRCGQCRCPLGFGGTFCEGVENSDTGCGGILSATSSWQSVRVSSPLRRCSWLIKADANGHVVLEVLRINIRCRLSCAGFLEIKRGPNFGQTGYRLCCPNSWDNPIVSTGNEMAVIFRAEPTTSGNWGIEFRFRSDSRNSWPTVPPITVSSTGSPTKPPIELHTSTRSFVQSTRSSRPPERLGPEWTEWSQCSVSCGGCGSKERRRNCSGGTCGNGRSVERRPCGEIACTGTIPLVIDSQTATLSNEWNRRPNDQRLLGSCCTAFERQGDVCVPRRPD